MIFLYLAFCTGTIFALSAALVRQTKSIAFLYAGLCLYFWSLHGAWAIATDKSGGASGFRYQYLEAKLFTVDLDYNYVTAISLYFLFCCFILITALVLISANQKRPSQLVYSSHDSPESSGQAAAPLNFNHRVTLLISGAFLAVSIYLIKDTLISALILESSVYAAMAESSNSLFTLHQILLRTAAILNFVGLGILLSQNRPRLFQCRSSSIIRIGYVLLTVAMLTTLGALGNKNELVVSAASALFIFLANAQPGALSPRVVFSGLMLVIVLGAVDRFRGYGMLRLTETFELSILLETTTDLILSNEAFAAHFSMYGVLANDVPLAFGKDIVALISSVVPKILWSDRPDSIYSHYVAAVGGNPNQGYTIHHATGWFLNFGYTGVVLGGVFIGGVWARIFLWGRKVISDRDSFAHGKLVLVAGAIVPWTITAYFPTIMRSSLTVYKAVAIEAVILPVAVIYLASSVVQRKEQ